MATKRGKASKSRGKRAAASDDTATLDQPSSRQNQAVFFKQVVPLDIAKSEAQTPSARTFDLEDGGRVTVNPMAREVNGSLLTEAECPDGHEDAEVATGTLDKTATCSECGQLYRAKVYLEEGTGRKVELVSEKRRGAPADEEPRVVARYSKTKTNTRERGAESSGLGATARAEQIDDDNRRAREASRPTQARGKAARRGTAKRGTARKRTAAASATPKEPAGA